MILHKIEIDKILQQLNSFRINEILLVATRYESFILEKDGQLVEQIHQEFSELNLKYLPRITRASTTLESLSQLDTHHFDLVITMHNLQDNDAFELAKLIKNKYPYIPVVMLLSDPSYLSKVEAPNLNSILDGVFFWTGDPSLFLAIIKTMEDRRNIVHDIKTGLVKAILVVDDSIQYYSKFLPVVYGEVMRQTQALMKEGINEFQKLLYMRTRPKILLASNYEDAMQLFQTYHEEILSVISDVAYPKNGILTPTAGFQFVAELRKIRADLPIILMSADNPNADEAYKLGVNYINKNSPSCPNDFKNFIVTNMGFGDFVFRTLDGHEIGRAGNMKEFQRILPKIPPESLIYHAQHNHISTWLSAHGKYDLALELRPRKVSDFGDDAKKMADFLVATFINYRESEQTGQVVKYRPGDWDSDVIQVGGGSLGGKARGIAFMNYLLANSNLTSHFPNIKIKVPKTIGIGVEEFDNFLDSNHLKDVLLNQDHLINQKFLSAKLSTKLQSILVDFLQEFRRPIVVRSSSLLEDSQFLPFAGVSSFILPNHHPDLQVRLQQLQQAIQLIYASVFSTRSKIYIANTPYKIQEVKMGIVIQELVGETIEHYVYPSFSGIAQSYNYYPFSYLNNRGIPQILDPKAGSAQVAMGFSRMVIEAGQAVRFCPQAPQLVSLALEGWRNYQTSFYALDLENTSNPMQKNSNIVTLEMSKATPELLDLICSTYNIATQTLQDDIHAEGPQVVTFAKILRQSAFPLGYLLQEILSLLRTAMSREVEIEFAVNLHDSFSQKPTLYLLQVRPLLLYREWASGNRQENNGLWSA